MFPIADYALNEAGGCAESAKNSEDNYISGRLVAKTLYLPARSRSGEGRAAPLGVSPSGSKTFYKSQIK
jgi:hypothetical protein